MTYNYIAIEGNIGAGKTSLVNLLSQQTKAQTLFETFENNPFLADFYKKPNQFALPTELFFLQDRLNQLKKHFASNPAKTISDYFIGKSQAFAMATLSGHELDLYLKLFTPIVEQLPLPDVVVYLQRPIDYLLAKIGERGRSYEQSIGREYLQKVEEAYDSYFKGTLQMPVIQLNCKYIDFYTREVFTAFTHKVLKQNWSKGLHCVDL